MQVIAYSDRGGLDSPNRVLDFESVGDASAFAEQSGRFLHRYNDHGAITRIIAPLGFDRTAVYGNTEFTVDGGTINHYASVYPRRSYRIVEEIPPHSSWEPWNIGRNAPDGFTLFCRCDANRLLYGDVLAVKN